MVAAIMSDAKPRILFLITTADWGGAQSFVHHLAQNAAEHGFAVTVAAGGVGELGARCAANGIPYLSLQKMRREIAPLHELSAIQELRNVIREFKPDVIHLNSSKMGVLGSIAGRWERVPRIIYRIGGWAFLEPIPRWQRWIYRVAEIVSSRWKDVIVTVHPEDEALARQLDITPRETLRTIPNGIDLKQFDQQLLSREEARQRMGYSSDKIVIGTIANAYPSKNLPWYIDAVAPLLATHPSCRACIIGDGPEQARVCARIATQPHAERYHLLGRTDHAATLLRGFDLFVLPSLKEGMPWVLLEAMSAELPCVATDVGACRWMLGIDGGIIIPVNDEEALRNACERLIADKALRHSYGENARRIVEQRFRWEATRDSSLELFSNKKHD